MEYLDLFQSSFRLGFSTETTLVMVLDDLWQSWEGSGAAILLFLNVSLTFYIIKHGKPAVWVGDWEPCFTMVLFLSLDLAPVDWFR